jgi:hypothetical protein
MMFIRKHDANLRLPANTKEHMVVRLQIQTQNEVNQVHNKLD